VQYPSEPVRLFLNNKHVGDIRVRGRESSWGFGEFSPNERFSEFATIFGRWSLLLHAADDEHNLPAAASDELRRAEYDMDALRAKLFLEKSKEWRDITQLNIDGRLVEWKEG
jgi:hypothetical protein